MKKRKENRLHKGVVVKTLVLFICSYLVFLLVWMGVKDYYGMAITSVASHLVTLVKDVNLQGIEKKRDIMGVWFVLEKYALKNTVVNIDVTVSHFSFNAPLTFAIMAAFYPFLRKKRVYLEVLFLLIAVHLIYVFSLEGQRLTAVMMSKGYDKMSEIRLLLWGFLDGFVGSMVIRFEPFLIGAYLYFKEKAQVSP